MPLKIVDDEEDWDEFEEEDDFGEEDEDSFDDHEEEAVDMSFWKTMPGKLVQLSVGGSNVWGVNEKGNVYQLVENVWQQKAGKMKMVSVAADGTLWAISQRGEVYTRDAVQWERLKCESDLRLNVISVGSKTAIWGVDKEEFAWRWTGRDWAKMSKNTHLDSIAVGEDGECWGVTRRKKLVRWSADKKKFVKAPGKLAQVAVGNKDEVWGVSSTNKIFRWERTKKRWAPVAGRLQHIAAFEGDVWGVGADHAIYRHKTEREELVRQREEELKELQDAAKEAEQRVKVFKAKLSEAKEASEEEKAKLAAQIVESEKRRQEEIKKVDEKIKIIKEQETALLQREETIKGLETDVKSQTKQKLEALGEEAKTESYWEVEVHTGKLRGAGSDATVSIVLNGENGKSSKPIMLDNNPYNFRKGRVDKFEIYTEEELKGRLKSISIGQDKSGFSPGWFLDRVTVRNFQHDEWHFVATKWLDGETSTISLEPVKDLNLPEVVNYTVEIITGDRFGAGTKANVRLELEGAERSVKQELETPSDGYLRGQTARFGVQALDLGDLKKMRLSHDNKGFGAGWFVDKVIVSNATTNKKNYFLVGKWLAEDEADGSLAVEIDARDSDGVAAPPLCTYTVTVVTGDRRGAGTNANVFIELYGKNGKTGERSLDTSSDNFERNKTDIIDVVAVDVGDLTKLRIGHDGSGLTSGWFLDKVTVRNETTGVERYFLCGRWLAKSEDDGRIVREIPAADKDGVSCLPLRKYQMTVFTADVRGAGTDSEVSLTLYGEQGDSGVKVLDSPANDFERGSKCGFEFETVDLGVLTKVRVAVKESGFGAAWMMDKIIVRNVEDGTDTYFLCGKWFASDEADGKLTRELSASSEDGTTYAPTVTYQIETYTGDRRAAGTDANVFCTLYGKKGDSGKVQLNPQSKSDEPFQKGRIGKFGVDCIDLGELTRVEIGHDGDGFFSGWFLNKVIVQAGDGRRWTFGCGQWLAKSEGDGALIRDLAPSPEDFAVTPQSTYKIAISTADVRSAGTSADVFVQLYGTKGKSDEVQLLNDGRDSFERGQTTEFELTCDDIGDPNKLRIGHNNKGWGPGWLLNGAVVTSQRHAGKKFSFPCGRWLSDSEDDKQCVRELVATEKGLPALQSCVYQIDVVTGDRRGAGTDANVYIVVYGKNGDTGKRKLQGKGNNFERAKTDTFELELLDLGDLAKVRIGHDNSFLGSGWFLDKVIITNKATGKKWFFLCGRWLDVDEDDKQIERELPASSEDGVTCEPVVKYKVTIYTGDRRSAGTDASPYLRVYGDKGESKQLTLEGKGGFERGDKDAFEFEAVNLGDLKKIKLGHDNSGFGAGWYVDKVVIYSSFGAKNTYFHVNRWLDDDEDDGQIVREIDASTDDKEIVDPLANYVIEIVTGDRRHAGTSADVFFTLYGEHGDTSEKRVEQKNSNFDRNSTVKLELEAVWLGKLTKLRIGHDNSGFGSGWFLDKVKVHDMKEDKHYYFLCGRWLDEEEDDQQLIRELAASTDDGVTYLPMADYEIVILTGDRRGAGTNSNVSIQVYGDKGDTGNLPLDNTNDNFERGSRDVFKHQCADLGTLSKISIQHDNNGTAAGWFLDKVIITSIKDAKKYYFLCGKWLDKDEDDGRIERDLVPQNKDGESCKPIVRYHVTVVTADVRGAGTDAKVHIEFYGADGSSGERRLENAQNNFERNKTDTFQFDCVDLGELNRVRIWHDNSGFGSGWLLQRVEIRDSRRAKTVFFVCNQWLDSGEGDKQIQRELLPCDSADAKSSPAPMVTYQVTTVTSDMPGAGTDANVWIVLNGENGATRKLPLDKKGNQFERGKTDVFQVKSNDLGALTKVRIGHNSTFPGQGWHLATVEVVPLVDGKPDDAKKNTFQCGRWLDIKEEDGATARELAPAGPDGKPTLAWVHYRVQVFTGDRRGAGTSANVKLQLYGENGDSGSRTIDPKDGWDRGSVREFDEEMIDLGKLKKIRIGHDNKGLGAGWFLDKVVVYAGDGTTYYFHHGRWLADDEDDQQITREIEVSTDDKENYLPEVWYTITVRTADRRGAGTDANVYMQLYGDKGKTDKMTLDSNKNNHERGAEDKFSHVSVDLGTLTKLRVWHDNAGLFAGWFLDTIIVHSEKDNKDYFFPCGKWLSDSEGDKKCEREIAAADEAGNTYLKETTYKVSVKTGDRWGAGTDANIRCTLFGEHGDSGSWLLDAPGNNFERNATDVFGVTCVSLGKLSKIRLSQDGAGLGSAWFVDKVVIEDMTTKEKSFALLGRWLDPKQGDGKMNIEAPVGTEDGVTCLPMQRYTVVVKTGDRRGAGTNAQVKFTLYGDKGESPSVVLNTARDNFERNKIDQFDFECVDVGAPTRIRIGHDGKGFGSGWFLEKVTLRRADGKTWFFLCGRWLAKDEDDNKIVRDIAVSDKDGEACAPLVRYTLDVHTADQRLASTGANVFVELSGKNGTSGEQRLSNSLDNFKRGRVDKFDFECVALGPLEKIRVWHDGKGLGSSWLLDKVVVRDNSGGGDGKAKDFFFINNGKWLNDDEGSVRELPASTKDGTNLVPVKKYKIDVKTADRRSAGTNATVRIVMSGKGVDSGERLLDGDFNRGETSTFELECVDLGDLEKIRIGHDNSGFGAGWFLDKVVITDQETNKQFFFLAGRWLDDDEGDKQTTIEIAAQNKDGVACKPMINYQVKVYTGDRRGAGTDANVSIELFGPDGNTGSRNLDGRFERNNLDAFSVEAIDLGDLTKIRIGHDDKGICAGWFLDRVEIRNEQSGKQWWFSAARWLSKNEDDGKLSVELIPEKGKIHAAPPLVTYRVIVETGDRRGAGTGAEVFVQLYGENGNTSEKVLDGQSGDFSRRKVAEFGVESVDLGMLTKLRIGHDNRGLGAGWFLEKVKIRNEKSGEEWVFLAGKWFSSSEGDGQVVRDLVPSMEDGQASLALVTYRVTVKTGGLPGAGTRANVFINLYGSLGDSGQVTLEEKGAFQKKKIDEFELELIDVGDIKKIRIGHDGAGLGSGWFLNKVVIRNQTSGKEWFFLAGKWFDSGEGDRKIVRDIAAQNKDGQAVLPVVKYKLLIRTGNKRGAGSNANFSCRIYGEHGDTGVLKLEGDRHAFEKGRVDEFEFDLVELGKIQRMVLQHDNKHLSSGWYCENATLRNATTGIDYFFPVSKWFDRSEDDGKISRELHPGKPEVSVFTTYEVTVATSNVWHAGTNAGVFLTAYGTKGKSDKVKLDKKDASFQRGSVDKFTFEEKDIGDLTKVIIGHDNKGSGPGWHCQQLLIRSVRTDDLWLFPANCWFDKKQDDGKIVRELPAAK